LPQYAEKVAWLKAAGFSEADATGWLTTMRAQIVAYNDALRAEAIGHPRVHIVDLYTGVAKILSQGVVIGDETLKGVPFGGLLSLDSMHFSDTGYAVLANVMIEAINAALG